MKFNLAQSVRRTSQSLLVLFGFCFCNLASAQIVNWMNWTPPSSYGQTANYTSFGFPATYAYALGVNGSLTLPNGTVVTASLTGEVLSNSIFPSLVSQAGYSPHADHILTFSQTVNNVLMNVGSLGNGGQQSAYRFNQDFVILTGECVTPGLNNCLWKTMDGGLPTLNGREGSGRIQFLGTYNQISWTTTVPEYYSFFNIGVTSADPPGYVAPSAVKNIPTLSEWGMIFMASLILMFGIRKMRHGK